MLINENIMTRENSFSNNIPKFIKCLTVNMLTNGGSETSKCIFPIIRT